MGTLFHSGVSDDEIIQSYRIVPYRSIPLMIITLIIVISISVIFLAIFEGIGVINILIVSVILIVIFSLAFYFSLPLFEGILVTRMSLSKKLFVFKNMRYSYYVDHNYLYIDYNLRTHNNMIHINRNMVKNKIPITNIDKIIPLIKFEDEKIDVNNFNLLRNSIYSKYGVYFYPNYPIGKLLLIKTTDSIDLINYDFQLSPYKSYKVNTNILILDIRQDEWTKFQRLILSYQGKKLPVKNDIQKKNDYSNCPKCHRKLEFTELPRKCPFCNTPLS